MNSTNKQAPRPTPRTTVRRVAERGHYDRETVFKIIDEALVAHVGFVDAEQPYVIPMVHFRHHDSLYLHGSPGSRALRTLASGVPACVSFCLVDGLVLARSALHHSVNYRSVVVLGRGREVTDLGAKEELLHTLMEKIIPGRSAGCRMPNSKEIRATKIVEIPLDECSAKIRSGPPVDDEADHGNEYWAGVVPLTIVAGAPLAVIESPEHVREYCRGRSCTCR